MAQTIILALLEMLGLFLLVVFSKNRIEKKLKIKICAVCTAVSLTWMTLLILKFANIIIDNLLMGILMGGSVVGIIYTFEKKIKEARKEKLLWLKIIIMILGTSFVYLLLSEIYTLVFWMILMISIFLLIYILASLNEKNNGSEKYGKENYSKYSEEIKKIEEKLEHCCD